MGDDLTAVVGANMPQLGGGNVIFGLGQNFVLEADEYDGCFLGLSPYVAVVTNIEWEHVDIFPNEDAVKKTFRKFLQRIRKGGHLILCGDRAVLIHQSEALTGCKNSSGAYSLVNESEHGNVSNRLMTHDSEVSNVRFSVTTYGISTMNEWCASSIVPNSQGGSDYVLYHMGIPVAEISLQLPGVHNVLNSLAVIVTVLTLVGKKNVTYEVINNIKLHLKFFCGVARRFEKIGEIHGCHIYDDYAHHPTEIRAVLQAALYLFSRLAALMKDFAAAFRDANHVIVTEGNVVDKLVHDISKDGAQEIVILTLGAGDITTVGPRLLRELKQRDYVSSEHSQSASVELCIRLVYVYLTSIMAACARLWVDSRLLMESMRNMCSLETQALHIEETLVMWHPPTEGSFKLWGLGDGEMQEAICPYIYFFKEIVFMIGGEPYSHGDTLLLKDRIILPNWSMKRWTIRNEAGYFLYSWVLWRMFADLVNDWRMRSCPALFPEEQVICAAKCQVTGAHFQWWAYDWKDDEPKGPGKGNLKVTCEVRNALRTLLKETTLPQGRKEPMSLRRKLSVGPTGNKFHSTYTPEHVHGVVLALATTMEERFPLLPLLLLTFLPWRTLASSPSCRSTCGSLPIKYPLGTGPGCGSPRFQPSLSCAPNDQLLLITHTGSYPVTSISYATSTLTITPPLMSTCNSMNASPNIGLDWASPFQVGPSLFLLLSCSSPSSTLTYKGSLLCDPSNAHLCAALYTCPSVVSLGLPLFAPSNSCCVYSPANLGPHMDLDVQGLKCAGYSSVVSVGDSPTEPSKWEYGVALKFGEGGVDGYASATACEACEKSEGVCGYAPPRNSFVCVCQNGVNTTSDCTGQIIVDWDTGSTTANSAATTSVIRFLKGK
ncbi:hypothetical protein ACLOJK_032220 [Asimina triloba]